MEREPIGLTRRTLLRSVAAFSFGWTLIRREGDLQCDDTSRRSIGEIMPHPQLESDVPMPERQADPDCIA